MNSANVYTKEIFLPDLSAQDIIWLDKALEKDYHELRVEDILDGWVEGRFRLFRLGESSGLEQGGGIAVFTIFAYPRGKEFYCAFLAGEDFFPHFQVFMEEVERFAKDAGCRWITGMSARKGTTKVFSTMMKQQGIAFVREVS